MWIYARFGDNDQENRMDECDNDANDVERNYIYI